MKAKILAVVLPVVLLGATSAQAHFKLQQPPDWLQTDATGNPLGTGGTQKQNPCGVGTASGLVTKVASGSKLHIKLTETIGHPGHYRVSLIKKLAPISSELPEPTPVLSGGGTNCASAPIATTPVAPVIADGLFVHAAGVTDQVFEGDVDLPKDTGTYTLQVLEFMSSHAPPCFYHHCAVLELVDGDAGIPDGGVVVSDAGSSDGGSSSSSGGSSSGASTDDDGGSSGGGSSGIASKRPAPSDDGCSVGGSSTPSFLTMGLAGMFALSMLRRRRTSPPAR